jgi:predicted nucleotidyltransferase
MKPSERIEEIMRNAKMRVPDDVNTEYLAAIIQYLDEKYVKDHTFHGTGPLCVE